MVGDVVIGALLISPLTMRKIKKGISHKHKSALLYIYMHMEISLASLICALYTVYSDKFWF